MRKRRLFLYLTIIALAVFGTITFYNLDIVFSNPFNLFFKIESATRIIQDSEKNRFVIYNSSEKIVKIDNTSRVEFILNGASDKPGSFFKAWDVCSDENGNFYILEYILDDSGIKISEENIKLYDKTGKFIRIVFSRLYEENEKPDMEPNFRKIKFSNEKIFYYYNDTEKIVVGEINLDNGKNTAIKEIPYVDAKLHIVDCDFTPSNNIYPYLGDVAYLTKKGQIFLSKAGSEFKMIYSCINYNEGSLKSIPSLLAVEENKIYFSDVGKRTIVKLTEKNDSEYNIISSKPFSDVVRSFKIYNDSFIAISDSSIIDGDFINQPFVNTEGKRYSTIIASTRIAIFTCGILFIASVICLILWIYIFGMKRQLSDVMVQSMMIIGVVLIAAVIVINIAVTTLTNIYKENLFDNLKFVNQLSQRYINGDLVEKIRNREDFMNDDYMTVREQLHKLFNNNNDQWNADYYGGIYIIDNNQVFVQMFWDDSSGIYFPYQDDYRETPFKNVYEKGEFATVEESDVYGSWIYSLGPVYNSKGEIVAVLEVGKDLGSFTARIKELIKNINKEIITVLIILVLVMIEIAILRDVFINKKTDFVNPIEKYSVNIVRMLAFLIAFSYALPISYTPLMMRSILSSTGTTLFGLPEGVALAIPISAEMLATALMAIAAGNLVNRSGWKIPFIIGVLCMVAGSLIAYLFVNPYLFILSRTLIGASYGFALVTLQCYPMAFSDIPTRNDGLAAQNSGLNAGYCCGVAIGGIMADNIGFSKVYGVAVIVAIFAFIYAQYFMKNAKTFNVDSSNAKVSLKQIFQYFKNKNVVLFFLAAFIPVSICGMFLAYQFPVFAEKEGISAGDISRVFMANSLVIIYLGPLMVKILSKKHITRGKWAMALYILVTVIGLALFGYKPNMITAVIVVLFVGLGDSFGLPMSNDYLIGLKATSLVGADRSVGYLNFIGNIGQMMGPVLLGFLFLYGYETGVKILLACIAVLFIVFVVFTKDETNKSAD